MRLHLIAGVSAFMLMAGAALAQDAGALPTQDHEAPTAVGTMDGDAPTPEATMEQLAPADEQPVVSTDAMMGKAVVGGDGQRLGDVSDVILDPQSGEARHLVISSGGFLGIGAKTVAIDYNQVQVSTGEDQLTVSSLTQSDIEAMPEFEYDASMVSLNRSSQTENKATGESAGEASPAAAN
jgi:sporulation protein YlmC with PRC-barrel domain